MKTSWVAFFLSPTLHAPCQSALFPIQLVMVHARRPYHPGPSPRLLSALAPGRQIAGPPSGRAFAREPAARPLRRPLLPQPSHPPLSPPLGHPRQQSPGVRRLPAEASPPPPAPGRSFGRSSLTP